MPTTEPAKVDARIARTRRELRRAALELAAAGPIGEVSVAELSRAAGISRGTFYKHADTPQQVLDAALIEDLDGMRASFLADVDTASIDFTELWRQAVRATAAHVARFEAVYRSDFSDDDSGALQTLLSRHIAASMEALFRARPDLLPKHRKRDEELLRAAYAAFVGHGLMAILQVWFHSTGRDVRVYTEAVLNALPAWMLPMTETQAIPTQNTTKRTRTPRTARATSKESPK